MDYQRLFKTEIDKDRIKAWRDSGKKALGIVCCHVPFELLYAADILPVRLRATGCENALEAEDWMTNICCSFTKGIFQHLMDGTYELDGLTTSDGCMIGSRIYTNWKLLCQKTGKEQFFFEIIAPRLTNDNSAKYFGYELDDLKKALEEFSGVEITNERLKNSIDKYNEARELVKQIYDLHKAKNPVISGEDTLKITLAAAEMPIDEYIELLKAFLADVPNMKPIEGYTARIMLVGSAIDDPEYIKAIEKNGCLVVADLNSFGIRFLHDKIEYDENDIMGSLAKYYMSRSSCPRMMDGSDSIRQYTLDAAKEFEADGIIIERLKYCEKWEGETMQFGQLLQESDIPHLELERQETVSAEGQLGIRVEAFKEMLEE